jgi:hypothetical protein
VSKHTDISQEIKKYLNGELDAHAMHNLERRAQDDPFLMDALEGYEKSRPEHDSQLAELTQRLQQRTEKKERRTIPYRILGIAASILLFLSIGLFWYLNRSPRQIEIARSVVVNPPEQRMPVTPGKPSEKAADTPASSNQNARSADNYTLKKTYRKKVASKGAFENPPAIASIYEGPVVSADKITNTSKDTTPLNEMVVMEYAQQKASKSPKTNTSIVDSLIKLPGKAITGVVNDKTGPLPGVSVRIKGTDIATLTDDQGRFSIPGANNRAVLELGYIGYQSQQVAVYKPDSMIIAMQPVSNALNEVTTAGFAAKRRTNGGFIDLKAVDFGKPVKGMIKDAGEPVPGATVKVKGADKTTLTDAGGRFTLYNVPGNAELEVNAEDYQRKVAGLTKDNLQIISIHPDVAVPVNQELLARPSTGWTDLYGYLKQNAVSPDGKTGIVELSFTVNADNTLSDFKVIKSLGPQTNNAAIKLIWIGPTWYSRSDDKPSTVMVNVRFKNTHP